MAIFGRIGWKGAPPAASPREVRVKKERDDVAAGLAVDATEPE